MSHAINKIDSHYNTKTAWHGKTGIPMYIKEKQLKKELAEIIFNYSKGITEDMIDEEAEKPYGTITLGISVIQINDKEKLRIESWNYQSGDNSYRGEAYCHRDWGVSSVSQKCSLEDAQEIAKCLLAEALDNAYSHYAH